MPIGPQPRAARGTIDHPYSALNLRLLLAAFGVLFGLVVLVLAVRAGNIPVAAVVGLLEVVMVVDLVVIMLRRRARRRAGDRQRSLFE